jgi:hypothetical protein
MGFGFRKSLTSGPFRITVSKLGLSMSLGTGGARVTAGPRGTHVSFSKAGFYYRTRLDAPPRREKNAQRPEVQPAPVEFPDPTAGPANAPGPVPPNEIFGDTTPDEVVRAMNDRIKRRNYAIPVGAVVSAALVALSVPWPIVAVVGLLALVLVHLQHRRSKYSTLIYGNEEQTVKRLETLHKAIAALRSADSVWSVRDAGVATVLPPHPPALNRTQVATEALPLPEYIRTNVTPATLQLADCALYFFPDRLFMWHAGRFAVIDYRDVNLRFSRIVFLERERQPPDATIESLMRRSHADNKTIPALYYGMIDFDAAPALQVRLMTSRLESAEEFVAFMRAVAGDGGASEAEAESKEALYTHFDPARAPLFYKMSENDFKQLQSFRDAFSLIVQCDCLWQQAGEQHTDDWKRNAGAGTLVTRSRVQAKLSGAGAGIRVKCGGRLVGRQFDPVPFTRWARYRDRKPF